MFRSLPPYMTNGSWTLNNKFFIATSFNEEAQANELPAVRKNPGLLQQFAADHAPVIFDPLNTEHVDVWHQFLLHGKAMNIKFHLEGTFEHVPAMIMFKMASRVPFKTKLSVFRLRDNATDQLTLQAHS